MSSVPRVLALLLVSGLAAGCVSFSMFQGPEVLGQGELVAGGGAAFFSTASDSADSFGPLPEIGLRYGLGHNVDLGVKFAGFPPFGTVYGDLRWQITDSPVPITAGLGGSYVEWDPADDADAFSFTALYPSLAVGTDRLWVAGRGILVAAGTPDADLFTSQHLWGLVAGTSFGGDGMKLLPELELYFGPDDTLLGLGLGIQFQLRDGNDDG